MTEEKPKKILSLGGKLGLKKPVTPETLDRAGSVKQSFSHGRSKTVAVEVKRKRTEGSGAPTHPSDAKIVGTQQLGVGPTSGGLALNLGGRSGTSARQLTSEEREARIRALRGAVLDNEAKAKAEAEAAALAPEVTEVAAPAEPVTPMTQRERLRQRELEELRRIQEQEKKEEDRRKQEEDQTRRVHPAGAKGIGVAHRTEEEEEEEQPRRGKVNRPVIAPRRGAGDERRKGGKITVSQALSDDNEGGFRRRSLASVRRRIEREKRQAMEQKEQVKITRDVIIPEVITVQELANRMAERGADVIKTLMKLGVMATITQSIDADTAELVVGEFGHRIKRVSEADVEATSSGIEDTPENLKPRAPIVTVMGHVDHGKTSLLDAFRKTDVVAGEAGGITQHIGAYQVVLPQAYHDFDRITFIDTPGHAAFTEMRARGANVTDIVVLVVAADDGIMPQTIEAIRHAKAANVPMIVAINKCDLPAANPDRVRQELLQHDVQVEEMGGEVLSVEISAKKRMNLEKLQEAILLQAEILDLKANPLRPAEGAVIEAKLEKGRGAVATVLVQRGTLKVGDIIVAGAEWGRVRALVDDHGKNVPEALPAMPVEVLGLGSTPNAGDELSVVESESRAREISEFRKRRVRMKEAAANKRGTLEQMMENIKAGSAKEFPVLIKGDVHGSIEAIKGSLTKLAADNAEVSVRVLDAAVGSITESDVTLAHASNGLIVGFNVRANPQARESAKRLGVEIRYYSIIYNVIDDVKAALTGLLSPDLREKFLGNAQILQVFNITKVGKVAGCKVTEGIVKRGAKVRLLRDHVVIHEGELKTLKRMKDEVKEVRDGFECGMAFANYDDIKEGDTIECFEMEEIARQL
jgi:translation initiation factor IF-2